MVSPKSDVESVRQNNLPLTLSYLNGSTNGKVSAKLAIDN